MDELAFLDGTAQRELVERGAVAPGELVEAALRRLEKVNGALNAVIHPMADEARTQARGAPRGPFTGVPFLNKDIGSPVAGVPHRKGARAWREHVPEHDGELVKRQKAAGLVCIGKTSTSELAILPTAESRLYGPTRNPWDVGRSPGGSSGGSAAAVAAGIVPMAHGGDFGGSIRIPASACGLFGLKPTRARNPMGPDRGDEACGLLAEHAITRSVRDSATLLDATAGPDVGDPYAAPPPGGSYREASGRDPRRLRIGFTLKTFTGRKIHEECAAAVLDAARLLESMGHVVEEGTLPVDGAFFQAYSVMQTVTTSADVLDTQDWLKRKVGPDDFEPLTWKLHEMGASVKGADVLRAMQRIQRTARDVGQVFQDRYDVFLTATLGEPPVPLETLTADPKHPFGAMAAYVRAGELCPYTPLANLTGQPAMSVPTWWSTDGLPIGTHYFGRFGDEGTLFSLAGQLERARPWARRTPPVFAG